LKSIKFCEKCVKVHSSSGWDDWWSDDDDWEFQNFCWI
jgi:hypothetical protein